MRLLFVLQRVFCSTNKGYRFGRQQWLISTIEHITISVSNVNSYHQLLEWRSHNIQTAAVSKLLPPLVLLQPTESWLIGCELGSIADKVFVHVSWTDIHATLWCQVVFTIDALLTHSAVSFSGHSFVAKGNSKCTQSYQHGDGCANRCGFGRASFALVCTRAHPEACTSKPFASNEGAKAVLRARMQNQRATHERFVWVWQLLEGRWGRMGSVTNGSRGTPNLQQTTRLCIWCRGYLSQAESNSIWCSCSRPPPRPSPLPFRLFQSAQNLCTHGHTWIRWCPMLRCCCKPTQMPRRLGRRGLRFCKHWNSGTLPPCTQMLGPVEGQPNCAP